MTLESTGANQPFVQRMAEEHRDLTERINRLTAFIGAPAYWSLALEDRALMLEQAAHMTRYARVLNERIGRYVAGAKQP